MQQQPSKKVRFQTFLPRHTKPTISIFKRAELMLERDALYQERSNVENANRKARVQDLANERGITYDEALAQEKERKRTQKKIIQDIVEKDKKTRSNFFYHQFLIQCTTQDNDNFCKKFGKVFLTAALITATTIIACKLNNPDL